jgi:Zn-dependent peptidase ImmA (M78 family)
MIPWLDKEVIKKHVEEARAEYSRLVGKSISYPIDSSHVLEVLFDIETIYDTFGCLNGIEEGIIGCIFPDGHVSPLGKDKQIFVNKSVIQGRGGMRVGNTVIKIPKFDPTLYNDNFTVAHEGIGHYVLHFLKGVTGENIDRPIFCRTSEQYSPLEWQANFAAGEFLMPENEVIKILDGKKPGEIIDVELYQNGFRQYFDASRGMMEKRLKDLSYKLLNAAYPWAHHKAESKKTVVTKSTPKDQHKNSFETVGKSSNGFFEGYSIRELDLMGFDMEEAAIFQEFAMWDLKAKRQKK